MSTFVTTFFGIFLFLESNPLINSLLVEQFRQKFRFRDYKCESYINLSLT